LGNKWEKESKYTCAEIGCYLNIHKAEYLVLSFKTSSVFSLSIFHTIAPDNWGVKNGFSLGECTLPALFCLKASLKSH